MKKLFLSLVLYISVVINSTAQFSNLYSFSGDPDGIYPFGSLFSDGTFLYGMTNDDGVNGAGTIYKIMLDGTGYTKIFDFDGLATGSYPYGKLISDGTFLYGMTSEGGAYDFGTIFKIMPDGSGFINLMDFDNVSNGGSPSGSLFFDGTFLYGMTYIGGLNNIGTLFKIMPDGSGYVKLLDFAGATNGSYPIGSLISDGTFLYGMTTEGGINDVGAIFKIMSNGSGYVKLLDFSVSTYGSYPQGDLILDGGFLYGMTSEGGDNGDGIIFRIMPDGTGFIALMQFDDLVNGRRPNGSLLKQGSFLYGMTTFGMTDDVGTVFKIMPDGTGYSMLVEFNITNGSYPYGTLIAEGATLYGTTNEGGNSDFGTIFKYQLSTASVDENSSELSFQLLPNPTNGIVNILSKVEQKDAVIEVMNSLGQTVLRIEDINLNSGENFPLNLTSLEAGVYIVRFNNYQTRIVKN